MCYGSFLNVLGYRLIHGNLAYVRSFCPKCKKIIYWYDLIPVFSWLILRGQCRFCQVKISYLYPLIEILTAIIFTLSFYIIPQPYWLAYFIYFSALIVIIRTDLETMLVSRFTTLALLPIAFLLSLFNLLDITLMQSIIGAIFGYLALYLVERIFFYIKKVRGIGEGDFEILSMIGAFSSIVGAWYALFIGSLLGSIISFWLIYKRGSTLQTKIPFGPWLALGAMIYGLFKYFIR